VSPIALARLDDIGAVPLGVDVPGSEFEVALVRIGEEVFAIRDECSHAKVRLSEGDVDTAACAIECYLHGSMFDLRTGAALNLPATRPIPVYPCVIEDGFVLVDIDNPITNQEN
jgi:3-phenylpropionate/trans-cinnamate dioxygenase ferredoxin subunit